MVLGRHSLSTTESGSVTVQVTKLVVHEKWNSNNVANGYVLSRLALSGVELVVAWRGVNPPVLCSFCTEGKELSPPRDGATPVAAGAHMGMVELPEEGEVKACGRVCYPACGGWGQPGMVHVKMTNRQAGIANTPVLPFF